MGSANLRFPGPFLQKQIPSSGERGFVDREIKAELKGLKDQEDRGGARTGIGIGPIEEGKEAARPIALLHHINTTLLGVVLGGKGAMLGETPALFRRERMGLTWCAIEFAAGH
jgi:hypothetical protein